MKLMLGNNIESLKQLPDNFVDLTITSPPYNIGKGVRGNKYVNSLDTMSEIEYEYIIQCAIKELIRVTKYYTFFNFQLLKDNKIAYLSLMNTFKENIKEVIIWNKNNPPASIEPTTLASSYEYILVLTKPELAIKRSFERCNFNNRKKGQYNLNSFNGNVSSHNTMLQDRGTNRAVFPSYFVNWFLDKFAQKGDLVFDPFSGSGTTALFSKLKGMNYLGFELDNDQVEHSKKRLMQETLFSNKLELEEGV